MVSVCLSVYGDKQGRADTRPLDLLVARSNRVGGLFTVQTFSSCSPLPLTSFLPLSLAHSLALSPPTVVIAYKTQRIRLSVCPSVEVLKPKSLLIKLSPQTRGPKNYSGPRVLTSYFYFYVHFRATIAGGPYFLLLLLRPFPRNNCRRQWGRYFWDLEGG